jgi:hypothetical protein
MGRKIDVEDLAGVQELAAELDVTVNTIHQWKRRHANFPKPIANLFAGLIYSRAEIVEWAKANGRLDADGTPTTPRSGRPTNDAD